MLTVQSIGHEGPEERKEMLMHPIAKRKLVRIAQENIVFVGHSIIGL